MLSTLSCLLSSGTGSRRAGKWSVLDYFYIKYYAVSNEELYAKIMSAIVALFGGVVA